MVAPIIPALANIFGTSVEKVGLIVPAYLIPYGIATLVYGLLADRLGIHRVMFVSLAGFAVLTALTATATSVEQIAAWRVLTGSAPVASCRSASRSWGAYSHMSNADARSGGSLVRWLGAWPSARR